MNWWFLGDARARLEATGREMCFTGLVSVKKPLRATAFLEGNAISSYHFYPKDQAMPNVHQAVLLSTSS